MSELPTGLGFEYSSLKPVAVVAHHDNLIEEISCYNNNKYNKMNNKRNSNSMDGMYCSGAAATVVTLMMDSM